MNFKQFLVENNVKSYLEKIVKIFDKVLEDMPAAETGDYEAKGHFFPMSKSREGVTIQFWLIEKNRIAQTATLWLEDHEDKFDLHLEDVYIPDDFKNRGYMTKVLTEIRKLPFISGRCKVHVAVNPGWKKIIDRSGFEWL